MTDQQKEPTLADLWSLYDDAVIRDRVDTKRLWKLIELLNKSEPRSSDHEELRAVTLAALAASGQVPLTDAETQAERAASLGRTDWVGYHLAAACLQCGEPQQALSALDRISADFFRDPMLRDQHVYARFFRAQAYMEMRDWSEAAPLIRQLNGHLREETLDDFFPSPVHLAQSLLDADAPQGLLDEFLVGIELGEYPGGSELYERLRVMESD